MIIGSILGDGYLRIVPRRKNAFLEINHSFNQKEYVDWKYEILKNICKSPPKLRRNNGKRLSYRFYTKQNENITKLYNVFYKNGKRIIPENLEIDPVVLLIWYMDDGSKCSNSNFYLNTQQFDLKSQKKLIIALKRLGLEVTINKDKKYFRLRFLKSSIAKLKEIIGGMLIPSMKYKIEFKPRRDFPAKSGKMKDTIFHNTLAPDKNRDEDIVRSS
ncbi:MAG: hypothetical protein A2175_02345 [Candidatus Nealsonbacteria bacterium RBG_13_42_11]|uniref:Homing endonuclease LAGLIDADG domain-containing protein n=1 Tax=Candidatus Nealsonbacteria bacterium RBG_13_42_11 TaxID=1801663 RepID=A0A1G2DZM5_9BACT|nr:MAG: hypothetical protein A2175_02345 [Candidatus Nealsonbacteria bacterium RBG_13_42_11]